MKKPVALIIFNRPEITQETFSRIKEYQPKQLFVIADGPRGKNEFDICQQTRDVIKIDWDCELIQIYSERNLGCQQRIYTGINEVFSYVEEAIIIEDDCLPHKDFFEFCEMMLDYYRSDEKVMSITGSNYLPIDIKEKIEESYYFSQSPDSCGWATWRASWDKMDIRMTGWDSYKESSSFKKFSYDIFFREYWLKEFNKVVNKEVDSWFYPWMLTCWMHKGLTVVSKENLISNLGFTDNATHTTRSNPLREKLPTTSIEKPIKHPKNKVFNFEADYFVNERARHGELLKNEYLLKSLKYNFFNKFISLKPEVIAKLNEKTIYIFGTGEFGKLIGKLFVLKGVKFESYLLSNAMNEISIEKKDVESISSVDFRKNSIILSSIEGEHDLVIIENIKKTINREDIEVVSWKSFL